MTNETLKAMADDDVLRFYQVEYGSEWRRSLQNGIRPSANEIRERFRSNLKKENVSKPTFFERVKETLKSIMKGIEIARMNEVLRQGDSYFTEEQKKEILRRLSEK